MEEKNFKTRFSPYFNMFDPRWDKLKELHDKYDGVVKLFLPQFQVFMRKNQLIEGINGSFNTLRECSIKKTVYYLVNYNLDNATIEYVFRFCSPRKGNPIFPRGEDLDGREYISWNELPKELVKVIKLQLDRSLGRARGSSYEGRVILDVESRQNENELQLSISGGRR